MREQQSKRVCNPSDGSWAVNAAILGASGATALGGMLRVVSEALDWRVSLSLLCRGVVSSLGLACDACESAMDLRARSSALRSSPRSSRAVGLSAYTLGPLW